MSSQNHIELRKLIREELQNIFQEEVLQEKKRKKHRKKHNKSQYPSGSFFYPVFGGLYGTGAVDSAGGDGGDGGAMEELSKLSESRMVTFSSKILYDIGKNVPGINKIIAANSMADGYQGLVRYEDGNAYEIQIRPVEYAKDKENWKKYTSKKLKSSVAKITTEDMKQALWLAFKETADKIEYIGEDAGSHKFQVTYNSTFDLKNMANNIHELALYGVGTFILEEAGKGYIILKHLRGTGEKAVFDELIQQQQNR